MANSKLIQDPYIHNNNNNNKKETVTNCQIPHQTEKIKLNKQQGNIYKFMKGKSIILMYCTPHSSLYMKHFLSYAPDKN